MSKPIVTTSQCVARSLTLVDKTIYCSCGEEHSDGPIPGTERYRCKACGHEADFGPSRKQFACKRAAKDLLTACRFTLDWLESFNMPAQTTPGERDVVREVLRKAIAKAEGRAS